MTLKFTLAMSVSRYAWTESHYNSSTAAPSSPSAIALGTALAQFRAGCLGATATVTRVRISSYPANRQVWDLYPPFIPAGNPWLIGTGLTVTGQLGYAAEVAGLCLVISLAGGAFASTHLYLAGAPANIFREPGVAGLGYDMSGAPGFDIALNTYLNYLTTGSNGWGLESRSGPLDPVTTASQGLVTSAQYPGAVGVVTPASIGATPPGTQVLVRGWRRLSLRSPALSGVYRTQGQTLVTAGPPQTWTYFLSNTGQIQPSNFYTIGGIGVYTPQFIPYTQSVIVGATTRKRGGRFGLPRGRSSIRI